jgi:hypothetical protein
MSAPTLNRPASLTAIATGGAYFCRVCDAYRQPDEATIGEVWMRCSVCHKAGVLIFHPAVLERTNPEQAAERAKTKFAARLPVEAAKEFETVHPT